MINKLYKIYKTISHCFVYIWGRWAMQIMAIIDCELFIAGIYDWGPLPGEGISAREAAAGNPGAGVRTT